MLNNFEGGAVEAVHVYYIAGFPITDELYHYGIPHQEWGNRRFQYKNGKLTPEGRERYRHASRGERKEKSEVGKMMSKVGNSIKTTAGQYVNHIKLSIKKNHPWMLSDSQLNDVVNRMSKEKQLRDLQKDERASRFISRTLKNAEDITVNNIKGFGSSFANTSGKLVAEKMFKKEKKEKKEKKGNDPN